MANEGIIKVQYATAGLDTITVKILKPDDTVRDGQSAVELTDAGHANLYTNTGSVSIYAGDSVVAYDDDVNIGGAEFMPEVTIVGVRMVWSVLETQRGEV